MCHLTNVSHLSYFQNMNPTVSYGDKFVVNILHLVTDPEYRQQSLFLIK